MGGRALLVLLIGICIISGTVFEAITTSSSSMGTNVVTYYQRLNAKNIAQAGVRMGLRQLAYNPSWRNGFGPTWVLGGQVSVQVADIVFAGHPAVQISAFGVSGLGTAEGKRDTTIAYVAKGFLPVPVKGAISTNNPVSTLGNILIDGRDHLTTGTLISNQGILGLWTSKTYSQSGNSKLGGHAGSVDYAPSKPASVGTYATAQSWPGGYPGSPDSILGGPDNGFPEGFLKSFAQKGTGGSQYVTDPTKLKTPLQGVTYVELPSGVTWQSMDITGSGILIVHNAARNAAMKNLNSGTFTGLMILDDPVHIHTTIIGGLIALTPNPSEGNCIGNGNGTVLFSSQAILNATSSVTQPGGNGSSAKVIAWWD